MVGRLMEKAPGVLHDIGSLLHTDALGKRLLHADARTGDYVQSLHIHPTLSGAPTFEFALRERTAYLARFRDPSFATIHRVERIQMPEPGLSVTSDHIEGTRLSVVLSLAEQSRIELTAGTAVILLRQIAQAVALLHRSVRGVAHGLIAPERLVLTPHGRLVVLEHVFGSAIERLQATPVRLWREFRIAVGPSSEPVRLDEHADVFGLGIVALSLLLGRPLTSDELPQVAIPALLDEACDRVHHDPSRLAWPLLRHWLTRALHLDAPGVFETVPEAAHGLQQVVEDAALHLRPASSLEALAACCHTSRIESALLNSDAHAPEPTKALPPRPAASEPTLSGDIDWNSIVERRASVVATARDITQLFGDAALASSDPDGVADELGFDTPETGDFAPAASPSWDSSAAAPERRTGIRKAAAALLLAFTVGGALLLARARPTATAEATSAGVLVVDSEPQGLSISINGIDRGTTPARIALSPGDHSLEVRGRQGARVVPFTMRPGGESSHHFEFEESPPVFAGVEPPRDPPAAAVTSQSRPDSSPAAASQVAVPTWGWIAVAAPFPVEVRAGGRIIGTADAERIRMAAGHHDIVLTNASLGYREARAVQITAGRATRITLNPPRGSVHINASPWAEVWIDGRRIGETPLGNVELFAGQHEIVFRHPQFGEKRHSIWVTAGKPVRMAVEMP